MKKLKKSKTSSKTSRVSKTSKATKASKKVYKAKPMRKSSVKKMLLAQSKKSSKKSLARSRKNAGPLARIFKKPITKISLGAATVALGAFLIINFNQVPSLESIQSSVVQIEACNTLNYGCGSGSGFAVFRDNYIVTNYHVISGADTIKIKTVDDVEGKATNVVVFDPVQDIAILEWDHKLNPIGVGSSENAKVGDKVLAIGNPLSESNVVSEGIISSKTSEYGLMTTAAISPGSSGGALILDENHKVIGVTYLKKANGESMNYAVRIEDVVKVNDEYKKQNYYNISSNTIDSCYTTLDKIALSANELDFSGCKDSQGNIYTVSSLSTFYQATNRRTRFEQALIARPDWKVLYDRLSSSVKNQLVDHLDSTHSAAFNTNWKYYIWYANEKFYYACQTTYCQVGRYIDGYYPTANTGESLTGTEADLEKL